jgi:hypothetical protein
MEIGLGLSSSRYLYPLDLIYSIQVVFWREPLTISKDRSLLLRRTNDGSNVSMSFLFESLEVLVNVLSANFAFVFSFAFAAKLMLVMPRYIGFSFIIRQSLIFTCPE